MSRSVAPANDFRNGAKPSPKTYWNAQGADRWRLNAHHLETALAPFSKGIIGHLAPEPNSRIVDIGCGTGDLTVELSRLVPTGQAIGLDISLPLLEVALSRPEARTSLSVGFASGDAEADAFALRHFASEGVPFALEETTNHVEGLT